MQKQMTVVTNHCYNNTFIIAREFTFREIFLSPHIFFDVLKLSIIDSQKNKEVTLSSLTHTHTHTHSNTFIYIYAYMYTSIYTSACIYMYIYHSGFPGGSSGKEPGCLPGDITDAHSILGSGREDPLEEGMATHSRILAWRIPWTEEPGGLQSKVSQRVAHN